MRVAVTAALPTDVEHAGRKRLVPGAPGTAVEAGEPKDRLDRRAGRHAPQHRAVELRPRRIVVERLVVGVGNTVDEQVGVVRRQADHREDLAVARIHRHRGAFQLAERGDHRALQVDIDRQAQVRARRRRHHAQRADRTAIGIGLDALVAHLAAQGVLVITFKAGLADVAEGGGGFVQPLAVLGIDAADIADDVREQVAVGIDATEIRDQVDAGIAPAIDREARDLLFGEAQLQGDRAMSARGFAGLGEGLEIFGGERDDLRDARKHVVEIAGLVGGHVQAEGRNVVGQHAALAIVDQSTTGHDRARLDSIGFCHRRIALVLHHLQAEIPGGQPQQAQRDDGEAEYRAAAELLGFQRAVLHQPAAAAPHRPSPACAHGAAHRSAGTAAPTTERR